MAASETRERRALVGHGLTDRQVVLACVLAAVALRLPFLNSPLGIDEGGYAYVAANWHVGDGGIYGDQWVDRPPLLIALYAIALAAAGDVGVRLLGCVAAALLVVASAGVAARVAGRTAMIWAAVAAVALSSTTLWQGHTVNAELPAAAFVAASAWMSVLALGARSARMAFGSAVAAGVLAACALLVKQSFVDGFVFAGAALAATFVLGAGRRARTSAVLAGGIVGAALAAAAVTAWAETSGPGIGALLEALYGFRVEARETIGDAEAPERRALLLLALAAASGLVALLAYTWIGLVRIAHGRQGVRAGVDVVLLRATAVGLVVLAMWDVFAVSQGGNWWRHYIVQLVPVLAIGLGVFIGGVADRPRSRVARGSTRAAVGVSVVAGVAWAAGAMWAATGNMHREAAVAGDWLRAAARPGDTIVVTWGHPNVMYRSGMRSPYELSWSLPVRVRDPQLDALSAVVGGSEPPTWIVEWMRFELWGLDRDRAVRDLVAERYERVGTLCGRPLYRLSDTGASTASLPRLPSKDSCEPGPFDGSFDFVRW